MITLLHAGVLGGLLIVGAPVDRECYMEIRRFFSDFTTWIRFLLIATSKISYAEHHVHRVKRTAAKCVKLFLQSVFEFIFLFFVSFCKNKFVGRSCY